MKIAIYHNLPSGGGKRALHEMTRRLAQRHTVDVYTLSTADHEFCDLRPLVRRHHVTPFAPLRLARRPFGRLNQGIRVLDLYRVRQIQREVAHRIDAAGYDVVFAHNCQFAQSPAVLEFLSTPAAYYCAEPPRLLYEPAIPRPYTTFSRAQQIGNWFDPLPGLYRAALKRFDRRALRAARLVITNSAYSREALYRIYGVFARVGYLGVDIERFTPLNLPRENFVLSVGMLNPPKGFDFIIRSLALIDAAQRPALTLVGNAADQRERAYLENLARDLQVALQIKTHISDDELVRLYNTARLVIYTPIMEPFGFVPLEAMACGTAVVGVREAGVRESVVEGETGRLVDRDPVQLAAAIGALLDRPAEADRLGCNGRQRVETQWTWDAAVEKIEEYLRQTTR